MTGAAVAMTGASAGDGNVDKGVKTEVSSVVVGATDGGTKNL